MIKGTYIFKENGIEVGRSENIITNFGKNAILRSLANGTNEWGAAIAVGGINTAESSSDLSLYYEFTRTPISLKSYQYSTTSDPNLIIVKGSLDSSITGNIYEIGVFPSGTSQIFGTRDSLIVEDFSNLNNWSTVSGTTYSTNTYAAGSPYSPRFGFNSIVMPAGSIIRNNVYSINLSSYSTVDTLDILANVSTGKSGTLSVTLTDVNGLTSTFASYVFGSVTGYQIISLPLPLSIFNLSTISSIQISTSGTNSEITLDVIKISIKAEITSTSAITSRSVLTNPIAKNYGVPLDIEYYLQLV